MPEPVDPAGGSRADRARALAARAVAWANQLPGAPLVAASLERERIAAAGLLAAVLSFWYESDSEGLEDAAGEYGLSGAATRSALDAIAQSSQARWYFLVAGVVLLAWFSLGVVRALILAHAVAWRLRPEKLKHPLKAILLFNGVVLAALVASAAAQLLREQLPGPGIGVTLALVGFYFTVVIFLLDKLPHRARSWRDLLPGAIVVAVGTQLMHLVVVLYLVPKLGRSSELYGTLGAATVILLWLYLIARLIVSGAFLNAMLVDRHKETAP